MEKSKIYAIVSDYIELNYESECTHNIYKSYSNKFIFSNHPDTIEKLSEKYLIDFLLKIKNSGKLSQFNQYVSVLKIIYCKVLNQNKLNNIKCVKIYPKLKKLPDINKVYHSIISIENLKHMTILMTTLKTGLRVSELLNIKLCDIDRKAMKIIVAKSKGGNSEFALLTDDLLCLLESYYREYKPKEYLFEGLSGKYSKSSVNKLVKKYIGKEYSIHWLRHLSITYIINQKYSLPQAKLFSRHKSDSAIQFYYHYDNTTFNELRTSIDSIAI